MLSKTELRDISLYYYQVKIKEMIIFFSLVFFLIVSSIITYKYSISNNVTMVIVTSLLAITSLIIVVILTARVLSLNLKFKIKIFDGFDNFGLVVGDNSRNRYAFKNFYSLSLLENDDLMFFSGDIYYKYNGRIINTLTTHAKRFSHKNKTYYEHDITK